ncbi:unnamed protein product [Ambrosiozyma monospora]|uniref:Unnamed protein product n=1 Tax=Ambrosiozyma monospora TaxID=43982 RepID=A0ACB5TV74_AMBMO|nr:unnamed protein product [Ambrosiozyma monospora]
MLNIMPEEAHVEELTLPLPLYYTLTSLLNSYDMTIKLAAANVMTQYTRHFLKDDTKEANYLKIVPALCALISRTKDVGEITVNSTWKISRKMSPTFLLSLISENFPKVSKFLVDLNFLDQIAYIVTSNYTSDQKFLDENSLYRISDALQVLACIGAVDENYRELIVELVSK